MENLNPKYTNKKKKLIKWGIVSTIIIVVIAFFAFAYTDGKQTVNEPVVSWVSHTEYWRDDSASTIVRLADFRGDPYTVDSCNVTILRPDKSTFVDNQPLALSNIAGNWYRTDSLVGAPLGTYEQEVTCVKGAQTIKTSQSFHLNPALEQVKIVTEKVDALDANLGAVNVSLSAKIADTNQTLTTNIANMNTNLNNLVTDVNTGVTSQLAEGINTLGTQLNDVNISITGTVTTTGQELQTSISTSNTSLTSLLNTVNTNLSTQMLDSFNAETAQLADVNLTIMAKVAETGQIITTNLSDVNASMTNILNTVNTNLSNQMGSEFTTLGNNLEDINLSLDGRMVATGDSINAHLTNVDTSLTNLLNTVNTNLSTQMTTKFAELSAQLENVNLSLNAKVEATGDEINTNLTNVNTNLTDILDALNVSLSSQITNQFNNTNALIAQKFLDSNNFLSARLDSLEVSVNGQVVTTGQEIKSDLSDVNSSLSNMITSLVAGDLNAQLNVMLEQLSTQVQSVKDDTTWLTIHAMNDTDRAAIDQRFLNIDGNIALLEQFCSNPQTDSSTLCQEIYNIKAAAVIMHDEQVARLDEIDNTTTNTWNYMTGSLSTRIDSLLTDIGIIKAQTTDINSTAHQILDNQESQIDVRIIS